MSGSGVHRREALDQTELCAPLSPGGEAAGKPVEKLEKRVNSEFAMARHPPAPH
jgi:hypothetical protein